jgi:hypothetical protein
VVGDDIELGFKGMVGWEVPLVEITVGTPKISNVGISGRISVVGIPGISVVGIAGSVSDVGISGRISVVGI